MKDKDKEEFECWQKEIIQELKFNNVIGDNKHKGSLEFAWQAACEYKKQEYLNLMDAMTQTSQYNFKLQTENKEWREAARSEAEEVNRLQAENKKLRKALEFYANPSNYSLSTHIRPRVKSTQRILTEKDLSEISTHVLPVGGKRAREALKEITITTN
jgi:regulator of replication initiation timing